MNALENETLVSQLTEGPGYSLDFSFTKNELENIRSLVISHWLDNIKKHSPRNTEKFSEKGIEYYHELSNLLDHHEVWPKINRILPQNAVDYIRSTSLIKNLRMIYGDFSISDEENIGREEIYWRLVRPGQSSDMGPLHADEWFWNLGHGESPPHTTRIKVWIALFCEPGLNGFHLVADSHKKEWKYHGEFKHGFIKPKIDEDISRLNVELIHTKPGDAIVFHDKLLHGGAPNKGATTRVSMEFTMFVKNK